MKNKPPLKDILEASLKITGTNLHGVMGFDKNRKLTQCRGIYYLASWLQGHETTEIGELLNRTRQSCQSVLKRYHGYYRMRDPEIVEAIGEIEKILKTK